MIRLDKCNGIYNAADNLFSKVFVPSENRILINVKASVKSIVRTKKILVGILAHVFIRMAGI